MTPLGVGTPLTNNTVRNVSMLPFATNMNRKLNITVTINAMKNLVFIPFRIGSSSAVGNNNV